MFCISLFPEELGARLTLYKRLAQVTIAEKAVRNILVPPPPESVMRRELEPRMISAILGNKGATIRYDRSAAACLARAHYGWVVER
jgi:hypothetical protein